MFGLRRNQWLQLKKARIRVGGAKRGQPTKDLNTYILQEPIFQIPKQKLLPSQSSTWSPCTYHSFPVVGCYDKPAFQKLDVWLFCRKYFKENKIFIKQIKHDILFSYSPPPRWGRTQERVIMLTMNMSLTPFARELRKNSTDAENMLWYHLRAKQLRDLKFRRQQPIGNYIVDFVCFSKKIVIELDGSQHDLKKIKQKDKKRDRWLKNQGFKVLRFWNNDVLENTDGVLEVIWETCGE